MVAACHWFDRLRAECLDGIPAQHSHTMMNHVPAMHQRLFDDALIEDWFVNDDRDDCCLCRTVHGTAAADD